MTNQSHTELAAQALRNARAAIWQPSHPQVCEEIDAALAALESPTLPERVQGDETTGARTSNAISGNNPFFDQSLASNAAGGKRRSSTPPTAPAQDAQDRLLNALERAARAESALRALADECDNDSTPGWEERMASRIAHANHVLSGKCDSCGGSGWLGGPSFHNPGEGGEPCPDCATPSPQASEGAAPGWTQEEIEAVIACLGDDAAQLRDSNPEDERADNMDRAACMVQVFSDALRASSPAPLPQGITRDDTVHGETYYTEAQMRAALGIVTKKSST